MGVERSKGRGVAYPGQEGFSNHSSPASFPRSHGLGRNRESPAESSLLTPAVKL